MGECSRSLMNKPNKPVGWTAGPAGDAGDLEYFPLYCVKSCALVNDIEPAGAVVREIIAEAESVLQSRRG